MAALACSADVRTGVVSCRQQPPANAAGVRLQKMLGGQDTYVRLTSSNASYDAGTEVFQFDVTVQNLLALTIGSTTGAPPATGVMVFFAGDPVATAGSGTVAPLNADGTSTFTAANQPYYLYNQVLVPLQISASKTWQLSVPGTVTSFTFMLYVAADMTDENAPLLDAVWTGAVDSLWTTAGNWSTGVVPGATNAVTIGPAVASRMPKLTADAQAGSLRVSAGNTLYLAGFTVEVGGAVDAPGAITGGTLRQTGAGTYLGGNVDALQVTGSVILQRATRTTAAVNIQDGALTVGSQPLSISIP